MISQNLYRLASRGQNIELWGKSFYLPISAHNYATFKPNLYLCWSPPLRKGSIKKQFYCTKGNETCALSKGRVKKNQREIPLRRGVSDGRFSPKKKNLRSMVLTL